jgi:hypothetical protein
MSCFNKDCSTKECPICMDDIQVNVNCVTTDCGHQFHTSCLMKNVAHNGFGCPYCRSVLAEEPVDEDESISEYSSEDEMEDDLYDDYTLRGMRWLFQRNSNEPLDEEEDEEEVVEEQVPKPSAALIAKKLSDQGITMEDLVKCMLLNHEEYDENETYEAKENEIFGKFRIIISNYRPEEETERVVVNLDDVQPKERITLDAQPKERITNRRDTMMFGLVDEDN